MTRCRCGEPREDGHACWATQAEELEALRAVELAARSLHDVVRSHTRIVFDGYLDHLRDALAKVDEVRS